MQLGSCAAADALATLRALHIRAAAGRLHRLHRLDRTARASREAPASWLADAHAYGAAQRDAMTGDAFHVPCDVPGADVAERLAHSQRVLHDFGRLLSAWLAIVEASRTLSERR